MLKTPVLVILRGIQESHLPGLMQSLINASIDTVEITMNTPNAEVLIQRLSELSNNRLSVGAGTVLTPAQLDKALYAGSEFIVTPVVNTEVIAKCVDRGVPIFPGAFTPTEVWQAWNAGATMVKVFPAGAFGPKYLKELKGPLNDIKLMAVSGVKPQNAKEFFLNGASAVAVGGSIFSIERLKNEDYPAIENELKELINNISQ